MKDRIKAIRKYKNMKQAEFAQVLGIKPNTVTSYETGLRVPSDAVITSICREFNVSEHWLRTGEGDMFIQLSEDADFIRVMTEIQEFCICVFIIAHKNLKSRGFIKFIPEFATAIIGYFDEDTIDLSIFRRVIL